MKLNRRKSTNGILVALVYALAVATFIFANLERFV